MEKDEIKKQITEALNDGNDRSEWNHLDEVYPGIYIGDESAAMDLAQLTRLGVTHILNVAYVKSRTHFFTFGTVNTDEDWYKVRSFNCDFLGLEAIDYPTFKLSQYFETAADFIEGALSSNGKVLVHCYVGMSRSATLVIVYLMIKKKMLAKDAIALLRQKRSIHPNSGFQEQIVDLELQLMKLR